MFLSSTVFKWRSGRQDSIYLSQFTCQRYVERTNPIRCAEPSFVCFGATMAGKVMSKKSQLVMRVYLSGLLQRFTHGQCWHLCSLAVCLGHLHSRGVDKALSICTGTCAGVDFALTPMTMASFSLSQSRLAAAVRPTCSGSVWRADFSRPLEGGGQGYIIVTFVPYNSQ